MDIKHKRAYLVTAVGASLIPDIDVLSRFWDTEGMYQMWHRGITHSIFLTPFWALLFSLLCLLLFKSKDIKLFFLGWIAVIIHNTSDLFNAWGTGYLEPFSSVRITFGTIPIVDFVVWMIMGIAYIFSKKKQGISPFYFRMAWMFIILHFMVQTIQGLFIYNQYSENYDQVALSAGFIPWTYSVITKKEKEVTIFSDSLFQKKRAQYVLQSSEDANLDMLFDKRPEAKTLYQWAPFVVLVDDNDRIGLFDPRFYRNGQSFLFEYIEKNK